MMQTRVRIEFECALDHPSSHLASAGQASFAAASGGRESLAMIKPREFWRCLGRRARNAVPSKHAPHGDREKPGAERAATGDLNFPASCCDQSQTRPEETTLDSRQNTNRIAKPSRFALLFAITRNWHPVSACNNGVKRQAKAENPSKGGWCYDCWV